MWITLRWWHMTRIRCVMLCESSGDRADARQVIVRCGDSPRLQEPRPSDGLFAMEVSTDEKSDTATFHLKSVFVNTTAEGKDSVPLPTHFQFLHRCYTKLWMEGATRKMLKQ